MLQTADGAAQGLVNILHRMKEISVQYLNGTNESSDRTAIDAEFSQLTSAIGSIVDDTTWNGMPVLKLASPTKVFQVGAASGDTVSATFTDFSNATNAVRIAQSLTSVTDGTTLTKVDNALNAISTARAGWGATINRLQYAGDNSATTALNLSASRSRIVDTDYAQATADLARAQIVQQAGGAMLAQANQLPYMVLTLLT
jgi:flagellin